jgi:hypothetical protein
VVTASSLAAIHSMLIKMRIMKYFIFRQTLRLKAIFNYKEIFKRFDENKHKMALTYQDS